MNIVHNFFSLVCLIVCVIVGYGKAPEKIVNGEIAELGQFPYVVSVRYPSFHQCGGTIIDEKHILTAAHCIVGEDGISFNDITVRMGSTDLYSDVSVQIIPVILAIVHEQYVPEDWWKHDIGILTLERPIIFSRHVQPIALPGSIMEIKSGLNVTTVGWGETILWSPQPSQHQHHLVLRTVSMHTCAYMWTSQVWENAEILCATGYRGGSLGQGDSGGPLIYDDKIIGISSSGGNKAPIRNFPDIYTRVDHYLEWINGVRVRY